VLADDTAEDLRQLRAAIQKELADFKKREQKLHQEFLRLDQKSQLLDEQLRKLRAAGVGLEARIRQPWPEALLRRLAPKARQSQRRRAKSPKNLLRQPRLSRLRRAVPRLPPRPLRRPNQPPFRAPR